MQILVGYQACFFLCIVVWLFEHLQKFKIKTSTTAFTMVDIL